MKIGDKLSNLTFKIGQKKSISSNELKGKKLIVYLYPKDDTPGCTVEAIDFSKSKKKFEEYNTNIIGISKDSIEKHEKFKNKHSLSIDLASDDGSICELFDVWKEKSMYGKKYMGIERATFFFDENLQLTHEWRNVKVKGHVEDVLDFILSN